MYTVSVLIPVYGVEQYIERCARSLFEQSYPNLEYIFVDDCSPDRSIEILEQVLRDYPERAKDVRIIRHSRNKGLAGTRNTALDHAKGEFVCIVDSDDWMELDGIASLVYKQVETDSDMVSGNAYIHYEDHVEALIEEKYQNKEEMLVQQLKNTWTMNTFIWGRIYRRTLFEDHDIRCKEGCDYAEDRYQVVRLAYYSDSFAVIDGFVYNYNKQNDSSITKRQKEDIDVYLKNQYQHLQNWMGIRDFFSDKEAVYYELAVANTSQLLKMHLGWMLKYRTKKDFQHIVGLIDANEDCMLALRWQSSGLRGKVLHSYSCMWLIQFVRRSLRFVGRRFRRSKAE